MAASLLSTAQFRFKNINDTGVEAAGAHGHTAVLEEEVPCLLALGLFAWGVLPAEEGQVVDRIAAVGAEEPFLPMEAQEVGGIPFLLMAVQGVDCIPGLA